MLVLKLSVDRKFLKVRGTAFMRYYELFRSAEFSKANQINRSVSAKMNRWRLKNKEKRKYVLPLLDVKRLTYPVFYTVQGFFIRIGL